MSSEPSPDFVLPKEFKQIGVTNEQGQTYYLVVDAENPSPFQQHFVDHRYVPGNSRLLIKCLSSTGTLIDIGANIGTVCIPVAKRGSRILALEILPSNVAKLTLAMRINRLESEMRILQAGVTHSDGLVGFAGQEAWGQISDSPDSPRVDGLRLDTIIDRLRREDSNFLRPPIVMKIDVEGHEWAVLKGAEGFLRDHRPLFIFESIQPAQEAPGVTQFAKEFVIAQGYSMYAIRGNVLAPYLGDEAQISVVYDLLAVPSDNAGILANLMPDFEIRPLTLMEEIEWLEEISSAGPVHRLHAKVIASKLKTRANSEVDELKRINALLEVQP